MCLLPAIPPLGDTETFGTVTGSEAAGISVGLELTLGLGIAGGLDVAVVNARLADPVLWQDGQC